METSLAIIISLFIAVVVIGLFARKTNLPYPIALVFGGLLLSLIPVFFPRLPAVWLDPNIIFLTVLPPILFAGGYFTSLGGFKKNGLMIALLAVGLVIFTTLVVAAIAHAYSGMPWAAAFALGAIISPTDATAAMAITQRLRISHNIITIIDAESLINDATALVLFRLSLGALALGSFSLGAASLAFLYVCAGGIMIGYLIGLVASYMIRRIDDPSLCITVSLITPYLSYLLANELQLSGVLAAVTSGLYMGFFLPKRIDSLIHIEAVTVWRTIVFLINGAIFILIGLQLPHIMDDLNHIPVMELIVFPLLINVAHIAVRFLWVFATMYLPTKLSPHLRAKYPYLHAKHALIVSWCGMRGVISLAAAMAIPLVLEGNAIQDRSIIVYLTFSVIFFTLAIQGLTLPFLIKKFGLVDEQQELVDEALLKKRIAETAIGRLKEMSLGQEEGALHLIKRLELKYEDSLAWANNIIARTEDEANHVYTRSKKIQKELLKAQRDEVLQLHEQGLISQQLLRKVLSNIDFESAHLSDRS